MATRPLPRTRDRQTWAQPAPIAPRRKRFRWLRRLLKLTVLLVILGVGAWIYMLQVYAPGLRAEAHRIPRSEISPYLQQAIVAIEDRRFYSHPGIDPLGMVRALWVNLTQQHVDQGGSTLEQQLVKRTLVPDDRDVHGKLREIALAWAVDQDFSKTRIVELYLNAVYYGQGAYGAQEAARIYFGTDAAHLTLPEAAFLAALPQAPSIYGANPNGAAIRARQQRVLLDMEELGYISSSQQQEADRTPLSFSLPNP
jgi:penicillin-binding protein 1A